MPHALLCAMAPDGVVHAVRDTLEAGSLFNSVTPLRLADASSESSARIGAEKQRLGEMHGCSPTEVVVLLVEAVSEGTASGVLSPAAVPYDFRFIWTRTSTPEELVAKLTTFVAPPGTAFTSTRSDARTSLSFLSVVREGLAPDGGLFNLRTIPKMGAAELGFIMGGSSDAADVTLSYGDVASMVLERLVDHSISPAKLRDLIDRAYDREGWSGRSNICPVSPLLAEEASEAVAEPTDTYGTAYLIEQFHGPTAAFKDFALQLFPRYFAEAVAAGTVDGDTDGGLKYMILAATSGDTGVAAISGFVRSSPSTKVAVLYPQNGVSPVQRMQMISFDNGSSVRVHGVSSDFDFCQQSVKHIFTDAKLAKQLHHDAHTKLSSANSINWGRLIPQVVYYFWTYRSLVLRGVLKAGEPLDIAVPTGNFGNILSAYFAKEMGLPIAKLVLASNQNDVLAEFITTGVYDIRQRHLSPTASPSIDILKASNVERFLFALSGGDSALVSRLMQQLQDEKCFTVPNDLRAKISAHWWAASASEEECGRAIHDVFIASGNRRIIDPHTAVAAHTVAKYRAAFPERAHIPIAIASTAHWAKFPQPVLCALKGEPMAFDSTAVPNMAEQVGGFYAGVLACCPREKVHPALRDALEAAKTSQKPARLLAANIPAIAEEVVAFARS